MSIEKLNKLFKKRKQDIEVAETQYNRIISKQPELIFSELSERNNFQILDNAIRSKDFNNLLLLEKLGFDFTQHSLKLKADLCYKNSAKFENWQQYFSLFLNHKLIPVNKSNEDYIDSPYTIFEELISNNDYEKITFLQKHNLSPAIRNISNLILHKITTLDYENLKKLNEHGIIARENDLFGFLLIEIQQSKSERNQHNISQLENILNLFVETNVINFQTSPFVALALMNNNNVPEQLVNKFLQQNNPDMKIIDQHDLHSMDKILGLYTNLVMDDNKLLNHLKQYGFPEKRLNAFRLVSRSLKHSSPTLFIDNFNDFKSRIDAAGIADLAYSAIDKEKEYSQPILTEFFNRITNDNMLKMGSFAKKMINFYEDNPNENTTIFSNAFLESTIDADFKMQFFLDLISKHNFSKKTWHENLISDLGIQIIEMQKETLKNHIMNDLTPPSQNKPRI